jgi:hypothetical protein
MNLPDKPESVKQDNAAWYVYTTGPRPYGDAEISTTVGDMPVTVGFVGGEYARRIVAAVNATSALSTGSLDAGIVDRMISALHAISLFPGNVNHDKPGGPNDAAYLGGLVMDMKKFADAILAEIGVK